MKENFKGEPPRTFRLKPETTIPAKFYTKELVVKMERKNALHRNTRIIHLVKGKFYKLEVWKCKEGGFNIRSLNLIGHILT